MDNSLIISIAANLLFVLAFVIDRIYRIKSLKEYRDARDAQVATLKQQNEFLEKNNDNYISETLKKRIDILKDLLGEKEAEIIDNEKNIILIKQVQDKIEKEKIEQEKLTEKLLTIEAANITLIEEKQNLERQIGTGYKDLLIINKELAGYPFFIFHKMRVPIANAKGILNLQQENLINPEECLNMLHKIIDELDDQIHDLSDKVYMNALNKI